ncbi:hypothetical protein GCM10010531_10790 [Blastococcus jejuensis]|uniref:Uncharacterized protein n=1 Tax=Blastococcus jejuensis TaxID=351224 RepID=A0ABP6P2P5_9ACTN
MDAGRRLLWLAAAAAAVVVLVVAPVDRTEQAPEAEAGTVVPTAVPVLGTGPPRGSLAHDAAFVEAVRRLPWTADEGPGPALGIRSVVFVGDVPGGRWALVVGEVLGPPDAPGSPADGPAGQSGLMAVWFGGRPGAAAADLVPLTVPTRAPADVPVALLDQRTGTLVVVAAPGDVVRVSERPVVLDTGQVDRAYRPMATTDGIAIGRLRPSDVPVTSAAAYDVERRGRTVAHGVPTTTGNRPGEALPVRLAEPRGPTPHSAAAVVAWTAERLVAPLGLARHELRLTVLWAGNVPGPGPESGTAAVVAATLPTGAVVVDGEWMLPVTSSSGRFVQGGDCGLGILPDGRPVEDRVHALVCEVLDPSGGGATVRTYLVVLTPPGVASVRLYDDDGDFLEEHENADGVLVVPAPRGTATVEAVTPGGVGLGRTELLGRGVLFE